MLALPRSFFIGLAPMVDYTYVPFRLLCRELGADVVFTEMIAPLALIKGNQKAMHFLTMAAPEERPIGIQFLATTPKEMINALDYLTSAGLYHDFDVVDLNFGCPASKIERMNAGASLLKKKHLTVFEQIIRVAVEHSPLPVTVKMRLGHDQVTIFDALKRIEDLSADVEWITIHLRLAIEKRKGSPRFDLLPEIIQSTDFRVVANGNIWTRERVQWARDLGCVGVLVGRKARSAPDIFTELRNGAPKKKETQTLGKMALFDRLLALHQRFFSTDEHFPYLKRLAIELTRGVPGGKHHRSVLQRVSSVDDLMDAFKTVVTGGIDENESIPTHQSHH